MPNASNADAPIVLVSCGRSGSSLLSDLLTRSGRIGYAGETVNLIFDSWRNVENSLWLVPNLVEEGTLVADNDLAGRVVRQTLTALFPHEQEMWFQKPIGIPFALHKMAEQSMDKAAEYYWKVMKNSFPKAKFFTLLRNPFDVVVSAKAFWGHAEHDCWYAVAFQSAIINHPDSPITFAVSFEQLVSDPESQVRALYDYLELPFDEEALESFKKVHAPAPNRQDVSRLGTREEEWAKLNPDSLSPKLLAHIQKLYEKFNQSFVLPAHFLGAGSDPIARAETTDETLARLRRTIKELNYEIAALHEKYGLQLRERDWQVEEYRQSAGKHHQALEWVAQRLERLDRIEPLLSDIAFITHEATLLRKHIEALETQNAGLRQTLGSFAHRSVTKLGRILRPWRQSN